MKRETADSLERINREFYRRHAAAFGATRGAAWPGWRRLAARLRERSAASAVGLPAILDLGCGNGRLAPLLESELGGPVDWVGADASAALLEQAGRLPAAGPRERIVTPLTPEAVAAIRPGRAFELVAVLALLHHLPSLARRNALVAAAAARVAPGGLLALSFWRFAGRPRFARREVAWSVYNESAAEPVDEADLEPGDRLLAWGGLPADGSPAPVRYCHEASDEEIASAVRAAGLRTVERFAADGREGDLNLYLLLEPPRRIGADARRW